MTLTRIVVMSFLAIAAVSTLACSSPSNQTPTVTPTSTVAITNTPIPTPEFITYTNESLGFSMSVPSYWNPPIIDSGTALFMAPVICRGGGVVATVTTTSSVSSLQTNWIATRTAIEDMDDYALVSEDDITVSGMAAKELICTVTSSDIPIQMMYCMLVDGNTIWLLNFGCVPDCWDTYEDTFVTMLDSFQLLD